ncbi:uncharacterized protein LOC108666306 [Hyalella azteca]|uniref:Uncharacterized protein LOC108666306 n=1 Tax=Hyalella azteca TaxID=294128 RepID=A0A8B7N4W2_HYAAZ|nr:uncharacterized protein LOC108666306 [Hyalella azteca]
MRWHLLAAGCGLLLVILCAQTALASSPQKSSSRNEGFYLNAVSRGDFLTTDTLGILAELAKLIGMTQADVLAMISIVKIGFGAIEFIDKVYSQVFNGSSLSVDLESLAGADRSMLAMFQVLSYRLEQIQFGLTGIERSLRDMARELPDMVRWEAMLDSLEDYTRPINSLYHRFVHYQKHKDEVEKHTLLDFAESVVSHEQGSIINLMANIHNMVAPDYPPVPQVRY